MFLATVLAPLMKTEETGNSFLPTKTALRAYPPVSASFPDLSHVPEDVEVEKGVSDYLPGLAVYLNLSPEAEIVLARVGVLGDYCVEIGVYFAHQLGHFLLVSPSGGRAVELAPFGLALIFGVEVVPDGSDYCPACGVWMPSKPVIFVNGSSTMESSFLLLINNPLKALHIFLFFQFFFDHAY